MNLRLSGSLSISMVAAAIGVLACLPHGRAQPQLEQTQLAARLNAAVANVQAARSVDLNKFCRTATTAERAE